MTLEWHAPTAGDPPTTYVIEVGSSPGESDLVNAELGGTATFISAAGAPPGLYFVRVKARNVGGTSEASNEVSLVVAPD